MKFNLKKIIFAASFLLGMLFSVDIAAQSSACCAKGKKDKTTACCASSVSGEKTSGCAPSACRGAQTKFGEAKVITTLRENLIALKADMEKSTKPVFSARSYDLHGIIGETDDESLEIIVNEVKLIEGVFAEKLNHESSELALPENKAKKVQYISTRIDALKKRLEGAL